MQTRIFNSMINLVVESTSADRDDLIIDVYLVKSWVYNNSLILGESAKGEKFDVQAKDLAEMITIVGTKWEVVNCLLESSPVMVPLVEQSHSILKHLPFKLSNTNPDVVTKLPSTAKAWNITQDGDKYKINDPKVAKYFKDGVVDDWFFLLQALSLVSIIEDLTELEDRSLTKKKILERLEKSNHGIKMYVGLMFGGVFCRKETKVGRSKTLNGFKFTLYDTYVGKLLVEESAVGEFTHSVSGSTIKEAISELFKVPGIIIQHITRVIKFGVEVSWNVAATTPKELVKKAEEMTQGDRDAMTVLPFNRLKKLLVSAKETAELIKKYESKNNDENNDENNDDDEI